ncbi:HNH endonuclease [Cytobacillus firmus]|uniref:HNH endonuclease n=1 Tax=Cytobacillus firmus TaxID=1399 RepID=UPI0034A38076
MAEKVSKKKNPEWKRDELILALDLYFRHNPNTMNRNHKEVIKLSNIIRSLPIHDNSVKQENFRNPNGVYRKLTNFLQYDDSYKGSGSVNGSKSDKEIWYEFLEDRERLHKTAQSIINGVTYEEDIVSEPINVDEEEEFPEGRILFRVHKYRERNNTAVKRKKQHAIENDQLFCEICKFDFKERYGKIGEGYIECHHTIPISEYKKEDKTNPKDLILVCSNCHRMLHRRRPWLTKEQLTDLIQQ